MDQSHFLAQSREISPNHVPATKSEIDAFYQSVEVAPFRRIAHLVRVLATLVTAMTERPKTIQPATMIARTFPAE